MTNAPHLLPKSRAGLPSTATSTLVDSMAHDGLSDAFDQVAMGALTEQAQQPLRPDPRGAGRVRRRAATRRPPRAQKNGIFDDEIVPVLDPAAQGRPDRVTRGRGHPRRHHGRDAGQAEAGLRQGRHDHRRHRRRRSPTAPAAVVVMSAAKAAELGCTVLAEIGAHGVVAGPGRHPAAAARQRDRARRWPSGGHRADRPRPGRDQRGLRRGRHRLHPRARRRPGEGQRQRRRHRPRPPDRHVSGARIVLHLALELRRRGGGVGAAALCGGGGQGDALVLHVPAPA